MKKGGWAALAGAAAILVSLRVAAAPEPGTTAVETQWLKAIKANDLEAIVACYAPDAILWGPGDPEARGTAAIRETYRGYIAENVVKDASLSNVAHRDVGNLSAGWGNFSLTLVPKAGGAPIVLRGRFTDVAEKRSGKWLYVADHASVDPVPVAAARKK
jgi:uncharacterized protein (TIGR02246 family)